ncbi:MAG: adenosylcobinamide-GDP ribazoletransferase [Bryobacteraceae bacterium]|nr:adenosylcobinamide-GDP ribazoletransferase [Bryobacteraceae bacterium]
MIRRFLGAVQFLTIIPVRSQTAVPGQSALFFPVVGAALGIAGGLALDATRGYLPFALTSILVLAFWTLITGGLHDDGFADVADAVRAWRTPEHIQRILKDSRIGAHGAIALILLTLIRWQALGSITVPPVPALAACLAISRTVIVALLWITPVAGEGSALTFSQSLTSTTAILVLCQGVAFAFWPGALAASWLLGISTLTVLLARIWFTKRMGGVNGDCLGATSQVAETLCLIVFTCQPCIS